MLEPDTLEDSCTCTLDYYQYNLTTYEKATLREKRPPRSTYQKATLKEALPLLMERRGVRGRLNASPPHH